MGAAKSVRPPLRIIHIMQNVTYFAWPRIYRNSFPAGPTTQTKALRVFFKWGAPQTPENNTKVLLKVRGLTQFLNGAPAPNPGVISSALSLPSLFKGSGSCPQAVCGTHDPFVSTTSPAHLKPLNRRWVSGCYSKAHHHAQRPFLP